MKKISLLKANSSNHGNLINFIAHEAFKHNPKLLEYSKDWNYIWLTADLSMSQIEVELKLLDKEFEKLRSELNIIGSNKTNPHYVSLGNRIETFMKASEARLVFIKSEFNATSASIKTIIQKFGDKCTANDFGDDSEDLYRAFFNLIISFARNYQSAILDNDLKRKESEKQNEKAKVEISSDTAQKVSINKNTNSEENIFGNFQKSQGQGASADQLISEFKRKLQAKFSRSNDDD